MRQAHRTAKLASMRFGPIACLVSLLLLPSSTPSRVLAPGAKAGPDRLVLAVRSVWQWPVAGAVVRRFDPPDQPWLPGHRGVDLEADEFTIVRAAGSGVVWFAGVVANRPLVSIAHPNGTRTTYEPVRPLVSAGDPVVVGEPIGVLRAGHLGCPGTCLHWGLRMDDTYLDPLALLGLSRVRLLPTRPRPLHRSSRLIRRALPVS